MTETRTRDEVKADLANNLAKKGAPTIVSSNNENLGVPVRGSGGLYSVVGGSPYGEAPASNRVPFSRGAKRSVKS